MENDAVEKTVKSCYDLADNTAKLENYYQANKGKKEIFNIIKTFQKRKN